MWGGEGGGGVRVAPEGTGERDNYCRPCRAAYKKEHYALHRDRYIDAAMRRRTALAIERANYLVEFFATHPCVDCGEGDPVVLEFDHLGDKEFNIAKGLRDRSWRALLDEITLCDVVCANCHRRGPRFGGLLRAPRSSVAERSRGD